MDKREIPFSAPDIQDSDLKKVESVIRSGWLAHGNCDRFAAGHDASVRSPNCGHGPGSSNRNFPRTGFAQTPRFTH